MGHWYFPKVVEENVPASRGGHSCVKLEGNKALIFGGANHEAQGHDDLWLLDFGSGQCRWTPVMPSQPGGKPIGLSGASLTLIGDTVYLFGGQEPQTGRVHDDLWELDSIKMEWNLVKVAVKPGGRHSHSACILKENSLLIFGGSGHQGELLADMWVFKREDCNWYRLNSPEGRQPMPREMHVTQMVDPSTMLMYGGRGFSNRVLCDAALFDSNMMQWRNVVYTAFQRCAHTATIVETTHKQNDPDQNGEGNSDNRPRKSVLIYGGFTGEVVEGDLLEMDIESLETRLLCPGPHGNESQKIPPPRFAHSAISVAEEDAGEAMMVFGGVNLRGALNDVAIWQQ
ncbi:hypothetical protein BSKO_13076 [Bryopsis sp. KO-2023]|nr:hypothetical protein BSKO_13076 [Bryopsis sp. KO-2023]